MEIDTDFLEKYLKIYEDTQGVLPERLEEFGRTFREQGHLKREDLYEIAYESSTRSAYHVERNPRDICVEVTSNVLAIEEKANERDDGDDFSQIALISSLRGFKAPTASCVATALAPERHAVVDTRVWASLERAGRLEGRKETFDEFDYVTMIDEMRDIAERTGHTPAEVGYALFAHDYDVREGTLH
jgi:thermostable 8-oxoguanine DNA glycosylase